MLVISLIGLLLVLPYVLFVLLAYFFVTTAVGGVPRAEGAHEGSAARRTCGSPWPWAWSGPRSCLAIPVVGPLALIAMMVMGTGAAILGVAEYRRQRREAAAAQAAANAARRGRRGRRQYPASAGVTAPTA